jgi:hypothetical protein
MTAPYIFLLMLFSEGQMIIKPEAYPDAISCLLRKDLELTRQRETPSASICVPKGAAVDLDARPLLNAGS